MALLRAVLCGFLVFGAVAASPIGQEKETVLDRRCATGPQFWCANIVTAKKCNAVTHCIQTVWEKQSVPEDRDSICKICLDMVQQARDQLESNETQSDLRDVFEGSCKLIPIKLVRKECIKMADDFVPELVEALASQMNPQMVCSVAGLCNNANIDKLLEMKQHSSEEVDELVPHVETENVDDFTCDRCNKIASEIARRFSNADRDTVLENMLLYCGKMGSFSDSCASVVLTYFNEIYDHMSENFNEKSICHISGVCAKNYHKHSEMVEIRPMANVGVVSVKDDIPCELCEQLVRHLRDVLIANTTEAEFKMVLEGFCKQMGGFSTECLSIVDQYYDQIYNSLVNELDEKGACFLIGICPKGVANVNEHSQIMPLLPALQAQEIHVTLKKIGPAPPKKLLGEGEPKLSNEEILNMQLPIDRLMGPPNSLYLIDNGKWCLLCEYVMHFLQDTISSPDNEEKIKTEVNKVCGRIPHTFEAECHNFVDVYGDAIVALLVQDIDPSMVCPRIRFCPSRKEEDVEIFAPDNLEITVDISNTGADKPMCPLCLLAVKDLQEAIQSDKSKANIMKNLESLCSHLPQKLTPECKDFVDTYSSELVDMLINDFTAEQICVNLRLCKDTPVPPTVHNEDNDIFTNEIPDDTVNGQLVTDDFQPKRYETTPECLLCERVINEVEKKVVNKKSKEQIKHALEHACDKVKKLREKCLAYVEKHGDQIADLIMKDLAPKEICRILGYCLIHPDELTNSEPDLEIDEAISITVFAKPANSQKDIASPYPGDSNQCTLCQFIITQLEKDLINKKTEDEVKKAVETVCERLPKKVSQQCNQFVERYAEIILSILATAPPSEVCKRIGLCAPAKIELPPQYVESKKEVIECAICQSVVIEVEKLVSDPKFERNVEKMAYKVCSLLPSKYYEKCREMVEIYGQSMINLIVAKSEPIKVCEQIGMCFPGESPGYIQLYEGDISPREIEFAEEVTPKQRLVGANECTWGPSHWCANEENAKKCNMLAHCTEKYWKDGKPSA
ncbi:prosaposin [Lutzomyia longipalpis]|uniref:prosaposin n=1 Tax=Lutzomyia longipalpis TaxID=7200 RepID=UPI0024833226|nr:prosaposin [Lutzomyia longipalpis]